MLFPLNDVILQAWTFLKMSRHGRYIYVFTQLLNPASLQAVEIILSLYSLQLITYFFFTLCYLKITASWLFTLAERLAHRKRSRFYFRSVILMCSTFQKSPQKVRQKNQEMKVLMDQMRNLLWDINAMLTMRKWPENDLSIFYFLFLFSSFEPPFHPVSSSQGSRWLRITGIITAALYLVLINEIQVENFLNLPSLLCDMYYLV